MARRPTSIDSFTPDGRPLSIRRSSNSSNPNIFSDDYAVDASDSITSLSRSHSIASRPESLSVITNSPDKATTNVPPAGLSSTMANSSSSNRTSLHDSSSPPQRILSTSSHADTHRTLSTSSQFSIPRAPSPYNGPTAPSHPYGMYSQVTRASSVISDSTLRPVDSPFVSQGGPEHPYGMYQNTVPEEEDDAQLTTPLGFPVLGSAPASASSSSGNDVGDIVGTDGHVEQLPPYSRYADNVIAKSDLDRTERGGVAPATTASSSSPPTTDPAPTSSNIELNPITPSTTDEELARKEGMKRKRTNRKIFGLPFWTFVVVIAIVIVAALLGGVIGGVVGNRKGAEHAIGSSTTTTTVWLDADPASTDGSTGSCPTGHFTLPLNQSAEVDTCIMDPLYTNTWGCLDVAKLGINVFEAPNGGPPVSVVFDDYSIRPQLFKYGPQPADFNGSAFTLAPYKDKEDDELGVALFFSVLFDKLSILPADALSPPDEKKRSVPAQHLAERQTWDDSNWLKVGDQPWYCFWNSTISEFWIFLNQDIDDSGASATTSSDTSTITTPSNPYYTKSYSTSSATMSLTESSTVMDPSKSTPSPSIPTKSYANGKVKRQATQIGSSGFFPKLVKMVEKRKPHSNVQPYCQQMQVLNNWQILPIETVPTICIDESEYNPAAATSTGYGKIKRSPEEIQQMGSNCICEWFSDY